MKSKSFSVKIQNKINSFNKTISVDSDKSLSIRSFLIGSICNNISNVSNILESEDVRTPISSLAKVPELPRFNMVFFFA